VPEATVPAESADATATPPLRTVALPPDMVLTAPPVCAAAAAPTAVGGALAGSSSCAPLSAPPGSRAQRTRPRRCRRPK
jgi:hypothetical protein